VIGATGTRTPRQRRSRETSTRIISAANRLFITRGYPATTMAAVAAEAGVSVQSLYLRFGGKPDILAAAFDVAIVGDDEPVPLLDRPWVADMTAATDGASAVRILMSAMRPLMQRTYPLYSVVRSAAASETGDIFDHNRRQRRDGLQTVTSVLATKDGFRSDLTAEQAADRLYALVSEDHYGLLVGDCGWSPQAWERWCGDMVLTALFTPLTAQLAAGRTTRKRK
jgi:AcrR family transcriptional regulator